MTAEETRAYLQERLAVMARLMFWSFTTLLAFMAVTYKLYALGFARNYEPRLDAYIFGLAAIGLAILAALWRMLLVRRDLALVALQRIDTFFLVGTGSIFALAGVLAYDLRASAYVCLTYSCLLVLLRATIVPSTGRRTTVVSTFACLPMTLGTIALVYLNHQDVPGPVYVLGGVMIATMSILLATIVSNTLYAYRRQISEAMQLGHYTLDRKIGEGGNGAVYRARHAFLRRPTAIKLMRPQVVDEVTLARFEREVQHMSQLTHPNTVAVFDYGRSPDGMLYYAMEYLDGIDLDALVRRFGTQRADRVVPILIQVCGALHEAHGRGLIHRDIKPANIILSQRGGVPDVAKVVDFGLVKEIAADDGTTGRGILGTPAYLAPEMVTAPDAVGPAADIYALGAVGHFLLTGKHVFEGKTFVDVCVQHVTAPPTPVRQLAAAIPAEFESIVLACLDKDPSARPASAALLARQLRAVPLGATWTEDHAAGWWEDFHRKQELPAVSTDAQTITVDISVRTPILDRKELS